MRTRPLPNLRGVKSSQDSTRHKSLERRLAKREGGFLCSSVMQVDEYHNVYHSIFTKNIINVLET